MSVPDDKKTRLSGLSQDVIAVPKRVDPAARPREESPVAPPRQAAPPPPSPPPTMPPPPRAAAPGTSRAAAPAATTPSPIVWVFGTVAVIALALAITGRQSGPDAAAEADNAALRQSVEQLTAELKASSERVAALEARLAGADADARGAGAAEQGSLLKLGVSVRDVRLGLERLSNEVDQLAGDVKAMKASVASAERNAGGALTQVNQMSARLTSLADQVAAQGKPAPDNRGTAEVESQVKALSQRTDKIASDIRQLYRLLEGGR